MLGQTSFSVQNIVENDGLGIALTGMLIVFTALTLITVFIAYLPKLLAALGNVLPPETEHHAPPVGRAADDEAVIVAIGVALQRQTQARTQE